MRAPWCVVGGWAIELWLGRAHRAHEDIEIAIPRIHFPPMRDHLAGFQLHTVGDGEVRLLPNGGLPGEDKHQNWVLDPARNLWRMDIMLEPGDADTWVFRRDERIDAPRSRMITLCDGIPCLRAEAVLLFKAKAQRDKDEGDFERCLPGLDSDARTWLTNALRLVHPGHSWIDILDRS